MKKRVYLIFSLIFALLLTFALTLSVLAAPNLPESQPQSFYAQDNAGVLQGSTKDYINKLGRELRDKTKAQVVVVTVDTLDGYPVAEYGNALFRKYKLGDAQLNNGCLLLVAVKDHKLRIEVGYGLEGSLTDGYTGTVRDQYLTPAFKKNDFDKGISDGYTELVKKVAAEYKVNLTTVPAAPQTNEQKSSDSDSTEFDSNVALGLALMFGVIFLAYWFMMRIIRWLVNLLTSGCCGGGSDDGYSSYGGSDSDSGDSGGGGFSGGGGSDGGW